MKNTREIALKVLYDIETKQLYSNITLKNYLEKDLPRLDRAFITTLVYGVLKQKLTLDYIITQFSKTPIKKLSPYVLQILRIGIFQIMFLDKTPDSAAVNESVNLTKKYSNKGATGLVNGLLRNVVRNKENINYPTDVIENISVRNSFPKWLVEKWVNEFGLDFTKTLISSFNEEAKLTLRTNTIKTTPNDIVEILKENGVDSFISDILDVAIISEGFDIQNSKLYNDGFFTVQDISAMLTAIVLDPKENQFIMDVCAAPGGKTTHISQLMENNGKVIAFDIHEHKIKLIENNVKRMGIDIIDVHLKDASVLNDEYIEKADKVLVDAPCSGLGIIKRKPEIKWNKSLEDLDEITKIQIGILQTASRYVKSGGELVYSTCSINKEENEEILNKFINNNEDFSLVDITNYLPEKLRKTSSQNGYVTFYPNIDNIDGFFISKLKKR